MTFFASNSAEAQPSLAPPSSMNHLRPSGPVGQPRIAFAAAAGLACLSLATPETRAQPAPSAPIIRDLAEHAGDYTFMWWTHGLRDPGKNFSIQTSQYALQFDVPSFTLTHLLRLTNAPSEALALTQANDAIFGPPNASLVCTLRVGDAPSRAEGASRDSQDSHLIESGKFFQRRTISKLVWSKGAPPIESSLEVAAWPDRLTFLLRVTPSISLTNTSLEMTVATRNWLPDTTFPTGAKLAYQAILPASDWVSGEEKTLALVWPPQGVFHEPPPTVSAVQIAPTKVPLDVTYDSALGWFQVALRNDGAARDYSQAGNDRIERVALTLENPSATPQTARLNFAKGLPGSGGVFGITGLTAMLRDREGHPIGLPIQLSKNWHNKPDRYRGPWYRGLTMLSIPGRTKIELEYTSVNALWGGVPAASHAQLCLVGWGNNQLWEQAAIGSWGESLCFEPDQGQAGGAVLDTRPLLVFGMGQEPKRRFGWTANVGGADFLVYYDPAGQKQWNSRMKTLRRRSGPVLTETTYAGQSHDGKIDLAYTVGLYRTDDLTRGVYHLRYDVRQPASFQRLVLFQCGGDDYSYTGERKFAVGNETGIESEWTTQWGGNRYRTEPREVRGRVPWFSLHEAVSRAVGQEAWANRGLVIREWKARLGGHDAAPWFAERGARMRGADTSLLDILPPPSVQTLQPGDFVEAIIEHVVVPQFADDYYGPNQNLQAALKKDQNTWRMILREALGNDLQIRVAEGELVRRRPTTIRARSSHADFTIRGGLGYVPVTFSGLTDYRRPLLEQKEGDQWKPVNQAVHGNDFWQTDYRADDSTWEITYSLPLDTDEDRPIERHFRFRVPDRAGK